MREPAIDPERLAALLDGRLDDREREALLAELARSDDARELLGEAAAVLRELEAAGELPAGDVPPAAALLGSTGPAPLPVEPPTVEPPAIAPPPIAPPPIAAARRGAGDPMPREVVGQIHPPAAPPAATPPVAGPPARGDAGRSALRRWGALAAAAVVLLAAGLWYRSRAAAPTFGDPGELVALIETPAPPGGEALAPVAWSTTRGAGEPLTARARAVRFGARAVELEVAVRARDTATVAALSAQVARLLEPLPGSAPVVRLYRETGADAGASADSLAARLARGWQAGATLLGEPDTWLGAWLAAARVAASRQDAGFFRSATSRRALDALSARADLDEAARAALGRLRVGVGGDGAPAWDVVRRDLAAVLATLGS